MNDKSGVWGAASSGESPGRREMLLLRLVVMAHLAENPLLLMVLLKYCIVAVLAPQLLLLLLSGYSFYSVVN